MDIPCEKLRGLDLFSGIGGIAEALEPWVETIAYCERERYPQAVLLSRMERGEIDTAPIWNGVTTLNKETLNEAGIEGVDIISGGWPCQGNSVAAAGHGARLGMEDERSGLVREVTRLVGELRPEFVFLENVAGVLTAPGDGVGFVLRELASLRYDCRWGVLRAWDVGAPHKRERFFMLAHDSESDGKRFIEGAVERFPRSQREFDRLYKNWSRRCSVFEPKLWGTFNGLSNQYHRNQCLGNSVVPQCAREAFQRLVYGC